jgi:hypothetical protein
LPKQSKSIPPLKAEGDALEGIVRNQAKILSEKNRIITEHEKKIYELKKTTQELEKFKYVLDNTIKDLNKEINPKEAEIKELKDAIAKEDERLKNYNSANTNFEILVGQLAEESVKLAQKITEAKDKLTRFDYKLEGLKHFMSNCVELIQDHDALKTKLVEFRVEEIKESQNDNFVDNEYRNQLNYLTNSLETFKENIQKGAELHKIDNRNSIKENIQLIREILKLRKEIKTFKVTEKPETITMRKEKKLKNISDEDTRLLDLAEKEQYCLEQELAISQLRAECEELVKVKNISYKISS